MTKLPTELRQIIEHLHKGAYAPATLLQVELLDRKLTCLVCDCQEFAQTSRDLGSVRQGVVMCLDCGRRWRLRSALDRMGFPHMSLTEARETVRKRTEARSKLP